MSETPPQAKPKIWAAVLIAAVVILAAVFFFAHRTDREAVQANANGTGQGTAYEPSTGNVVPAGAQPGALQTGAPNSLGEPNDSAGSTAGGETTGNAAGANTTR